VWNLEQPSFVIVPREPKLCQARLSCRAARIQFILQLSFWQFIPMYRTRVQQF